MHKYLHRLRRELLCMLAHSLVRNAQVAPFFVAYAAQAGRCSLEGIAEGICKSCYGQQPGSIVSGFHGVLVVRGS